MFWGKATNYMSEVQLPRYYKSVRKPKIVPWRSHVERQMPPGQSPAAPANPAGEPDV